MLNHETIMAISLAYHSEVEMVIEPVDSALGRLSEAERLLVKTFREMDETGQTLVSELLEYVAVNAKPTRK